MTRDRHDVSAAGIAAARTSAPAAPRLEAEAHAASGAASLAAAAGPLPSYAPDRIADYLQSGFWSSVGEDPRKFNMGATGPSANAGVLRYNVNDLTSPGAELAEQALAVYERVLGIDFVRTSSAGAETDLMFFDGDEGAYSRTYVDGASSAISFSTVNISRDWLATYGPSVVSYSFQTYLHEIGHALGLGHAGPYNERATFVLDQGDPDYGNSSNIYRNDSWQSSMMSYFSQTENTTTGASFAFLLSPMAADWIALTDMYGLGRGAFAGDTTWGFNTNIKEAVFASLADYADETAFTIIDRGGVDTLDFSGYAAKQTIDLNAESVSSIGGLRGNMVIARGVTIENAVGGAGADRLTGNAADNALRGGGGSDTLRGGAGRDTLNGNKGADVMEGGAGDDAYYADRASDRVAEAAGAGADTVFAEADYTLVPNVERLVLTGTRSSNGTGAAGAEALWGNAQANVLRGLAGADSLRGGAGADELVGGAGADIFQFLSPADSDPAARDTLAAGDGATAFQGAGAAAGDRFDFTLFDADETRAGVQDFTFGTPGGKGRLWARDSGALTLIRGDVDRDRAPEFELALEDGAVLASAYTQADFLV